MISCSEGYKDRKRNHDCRIFRWSANWEKESVTLKEEAEAEVEVHVHPRPIPTSFQCWLTTGGVRRRRAAGEARQCAYAFAGPEH